MRKLFIILLFFVPLVSFASEKINTSDWRLYRNTDLGFQVRYPAWAEVSSSREGSYSVIHFNHPSLGNGGLGWMIVSRDKTDVMKEGIRQEAEYILQSYSDKGYINRNSLPSSAIQELVTRARESGLLLSYYDNWKREVEAIASLIQDIVGVINGSDEIERGDEVSQLLNDFIEDKKTFPLSVVIDGKFVEPYGTVTRFYSTKGILDDRGYPSINPDSERPIGHRSPYAFSMKNRFPREDGLTDFWESDHLFFETGKKLYFISSDHLASNDLFQTFRDSFEFLIPEGLEKTNETHPDEVKSWPLYKNDQYGFEIRYPEGWYVDEWERYNHFNLSFSNHEPDTYDCRTDCPDDFQIYHVIIYPENIPYRCHFDSTNDCLSASDEIYRYDVGNDKKLTAYVRLRASENSDITLPKIEAYLEDDDRSYFFSASGRYNPDNSRLAMEALKKSLSTFRLIY